VTSASSRELECTEDTRSRPYGKVRPIRSHSVELEAITHRFGATTAVETSASLGARPLYTFRRVTLPVIRPGILAGAFIAFMASLDNVSVSLFLSAPETDVLPIRMWNMLESTLDVRPAAVSGVLITTTALTVIVMDRVVGLTRRIS
jgi:ABC-type spermidine/putrescine transport system permease subunit II